MVALIDDSATLKTLSYDRANRKVVLKAENDDKKNYPMKAFSEKEQNILRLRLQGKNMSEIASALGYHDASGVKKAIKRIGQKLLDAGIVDPDRLTGRKIS